MQKKAIKLSKQKQRVCMSIKQIITWQTYTPIYQ